MTLLESLSDIGYYRPSPPDQEPIASRCPRCNDLLLETSRFVICNNEDCDWPGVNLEAMRSDGGGKRN